MRSAWGFAGKPASGKQKKCTGCAGRLTARRSWRNGRVGELLQSHQPMAATTLATPDALAPEVCLEQARAARDPRQRAAAAALGLSLAGRDAALQVLLLRQLYLAQLATADWGSAVRSAEQMVAVGELPEVAHADAARAHGAAANFPSAVHHQRLAARLATPSLRAVQYARLGRYSAFAGDSVGCKAALRRAERWATVDRALYRAELVSCRAETPQRELRLAYEALSESDPGPLGFYVGARIATRLGASPAARQGFAEFLALWAKLPLVERVNLWAEAEAARSELSTLCESAPVP